MVSLPALSSSRKDLAIQVNEILNTWKKQSLQNKCYNFLIYQEFLQMFKCYLQYHVDSPIAISPNGILPSTVCLIVDSPPAILPNANLNSPNFTEPTPPPNHAEHISPP